MNFLFNKVVVVGLGQIGGSIAWALKKNRVARQVIGLDRDAKTLRIAKRLGMIDAKVGGDGESWAESEGLGVTPSTLWQCLSTRDRATRSQDPPSNLIILAIPVSEIRLFFKNLRKVKNKISCKKGLIFMDVGSTKETIVRAAAKGLPKRSFYVGAHPIAGTEKVGIGGADPKLFKGRRCLLMPLPGTARAVLHRIEKLWRRLGATVQPMNPKKHDRILSFTSHLPHMIAYSLLPVVTQSIGGVSEVRQWLEGCATQGCSTQGCATQGSLRDATRVTASSPQMWRDISVENSENIVQAVEAFQKQLTLLKKKILRREGKELERTFASVKKLKEKLS
ncbi:MAG: prephenate dehydrogenase/arogenate dehydrogenase family protein [Deltaproteobacteria bacterium]|nr:prephenate dehydrogenase/arogenate dehydrogenase family protein [Deltaproteobacteria bacterium]